MNQMPKNQPFYQAVGAEVEVFEAAFEQRLPMLLKGPTGCGKSRFVEYMAHRLGRQLYTVACHEETSAVDLLGRFIIKGDETVWQDGPLTRAVREGAMVYLDEIAEARPDVIVAIHSLTDHRRVLYLDRLNEQVHAEDGFYLVASYNPGYQTGWKEMKPSTRQRFVSLAFNYPELKLEQHIIHKESGLPLADCKTLVKLAQKIRQLTELSLAESVSTRLLVDAAKLMAQGLEHRLACRVAIAEPLSDEEDIVNSLNDLIHLMF